MRSLCAVTTFALLSATPAGGSPQEGTSPPPIVVNDEPYAPETVRVDGRRSGHAAGDYVQIGGIWCRLRGAGPWRFATTERGDGRLWLLSGGDKRELVGVNVTFTYEDKTKRVIDPLAGLDDSALAGLWGVRIDEWPSGTAGRLAKLDLARTALRISGGPEGRRP